MSPPADYINIGYWSCLLVSVLTGSDVLSQLAHFEVYTAGEEVRSHTMGSGISGLPELECQTWRVCGLIAGWVLCPTVMPSH